MISEKEVRKYAGMTYSDDFDCADFVVYFVRDFFGKDVWLPGTRPRGDDADQHLSEMSKAFGERTDDPQDGDFVLMQNIGDTTPTHGGVYLVLNGEPCVFHSTKKSGGSVIHRVRQLPRIGLKIEGIYKWL